MNDRKDHTIKVKILENWSIPDLRHAYPAQLRPRHEDAIAPALTAVLLELSNNSKGRVEKVRKLLRDAVRDRCKKSKTIDEASVTIEDVQSVRAALLRSSRPKSNNAQHTEGDKRPIVSGKGLPQPRRSRRRLQEPADNSQKLRKSGRLPSRSRAEKDNDVETSRVQNGESTQRTVPETPVISIAPPRSLGPNQLNSYTILDDSSPIETSRRVERNRHISDESTASGNLVAGQEQLETAALRKKRLEAEFHSLLVQENKHWRRAEDYRVKAAQHQRKALALRVRIEEIEDKLGKSNDIQSSPTGQNRR